MATIPHLGINVPLVPEEQCGHTGAPPRGNQVEQSAVVLWLHPIGVSPSS